MKYLMDRFEKGKTAVQDFLKESHRFVKVDHMSDAHADLLQYQSQMNAGNGSLEVQLSMRTSRGYELLAMNFQTQRLASMINAKDHHHDPRPDSMAIPWLGCNFLARLRLNIIILSAKQRSLRCCRLPFGR